MDKIAEESIKLHSEHHGKLASLIKVPIEDAHDLSVAYTPGVAAVSAAIGKDPSLARDLTLKKNTVAVVSDGSAILGLGDLGPEAAIPVMEGKAALFKRFADVDAFPLCLATQDTEEVIATVKRIAPVFGGINLEDIAAPRCFEIERRLREELAIPVMHDDQHGTGVVVLAGLLNALKAAGNDRRDVRIVVNGAGAAGSGVAKLLHVYGFSNIAICDSKGAIHPGRQGLTEAKKELAAIAGAGEAGNRTGGLADVLRGADVFIGVSKGGALNEDLIRSMSGRPVIFALANPVPEIMPDDALRAGAAVVATGRSDLPNQVNNALAFPGIFRGALDHGVERFTDAMFVDAAERLAGCVKSPSRGGILPSVFDERVVPAIAGAIR